MAAKQRKTIEERIGDLVRRMGSPFDHEAVAAVLALRRTLASHGRDIHEIADAVENGHGSKLSEAEMRKLYNAGFEAELAEGESRHVTTFHNVNSTGDYEMAAFCFERRNRLAPQHRSFVEGMFELSAEYELSLKQRTYLRSLFHKLGGKP